MNLLENGKGGWLPLGSRTGGWWNYYFLTYIHVWYLYAEGGKNVRFHPCTCAFAHREEETVLVSLLSFSLMTLPPISPLAKLRGNVYFS